VDLEHRVIWIHAEDMKQRQALGVPLKKDALTVLEEQNGLHPEWVFPYRGKPVHLTLTKAWHQALAAAAENVRPVSRK